MRSGSVEGEALMGSLKKALFDQLSQLYRAGLEGVHAGDLADKCSTRELVRMGLADNSGGPPSSLDRVRINRAGVNAFLEAEVEA